MRFILRDRVRTVKLRSGSGELRPGLAVALPVL
jgi:hypothetical protein